MKIYKIFCLLLLSTILFSCNKVWSFYGYDRLGYLKKNHDKQTFLNKIDLKPEYTYFQKSNLSQNPLEVLVFQDYVNFVNSYDLNVFIFVDNKLYTWGRIDDLKRHPNEEVRNVMKAVSTNIKKELDK